MIGDVRQMVLTQRGSAIEFERDNFGWIVE
jgi:hypothetical protein